MKKGLFIALLTAFAFGVGFLTSSWINAWGERHRPLPPPPGPFGVEFNRPRTPGRSAESHVKPIDRAELRARIAELQPQIKVFRDKMAAIDAEFDQAMDKILTPEQRAERAARLSKIRDEHHAEERSGKPISDDELLAMMRDQPVRTIMWDVVIPFRLDMLTRTYHLDDDQREKVRVLLKTRREKILDLIDSSPPPSVMLSRLAPWVERISRPPPPPSAQPAERDPGQK